MKCAALLKRRPPKETRPRSSEVTSRVKCAALLKLPEQEHHLAHRAQPGHKPREMRGPIETVWPTVTAVSSLRSHKPREMRGPIETPTAGSGESDVFRHVTSRVKCAALLKPAPSAGVPSTTTMVGHKPREMRGPIETCTQLSIFVCVLLFVTSRVKCAALLKRASRIRVDSRHLRVTSRVKCAALLKLVRDPFAHGGG